MRLAAGTAAHVRVPATSANLGPGFDSLGLALAIYDDVRVKVIDSGLELHVEGEGCDAVARDDGHLVVHALRTALDRAGVPQPALRMWCRNAVPHGRGLGSSAAAVVAGVVAARALVAAGRPDSAKDPDGATGESVDDLTVATAIEGHPDNAAAALSGGLTIAWQADGSPRSVRLDPHPDLRPLVVLADSALSTSHARSLLPSVVPHADAAFNAARSALLVEALCRRPELLLPATQDRLHQRQRAAASPTTAALVEALRADGLPAVVSGAGPSVLVLAVRGQRLDGVEVADAVRYRVERVAGTGWLVLDSGVDRSGARSLTDTDRGVGADRQ